MAIAFDTAQYTDTHGGASPVSASHTCSGSNRILWVFIYFEGTAITGVTYNGVSMTLADSNAGAKLYYLVAPSTGTNTISVSFTGTAPEAVLSSSYTGASQTGQPDATTNGSGSASSMTGTVTSIADNCWAVMGVNEGDSSSAPSAGANTNFRAGGNQVGFRGYGIFDGGPKTPAGSFSLNASFPGPAGYNYAMASFSPAAGGGVVNQVNPTLLLTCVG